VATREQAELLRAKMIQESQHAAPSLQDRDIKLDTYADRWLEQIASSVDARTLTSYRENLRLYIRPVFGNIMVRAIHRGHIKALLARKRAEGLSKNTVRLIRATLSVMLGDAVDDGIIQLNPALGIGRRGRKRPDTITFADRQKRVRAMTYEQLATFLAVSTARCSHRNAVLLLTLADAGLRPGEACAMRWTDFDPVVSTVLIERTADNSGRVKTTKTAETRLVDVSARLAAALTDLRLLWKPRRCSPVERASHHGSFGREPGRLSGRIASPKSSSGYSGQPASLTSGCTTCATPTPPT
jgi:integrase